VSERDVDKRYDTGVAGQRVMPKFHELVSQNCHILIDEIIRRAEQDLISPEEAIARFGVKAGTEQEELERIKAWLAYKAETEGQSQRAEGEATGPAETERNS
jgi:hypothetical protein